MSEFFTMGGYAVFVWPSYALTAVVMAAVLIASIRGLKETQATFERLQGEIGGTKNGEESPK